MNKKECNSEPSLGKSCGIFGRFRQRLFPSAVVIAAPGSPLETSEVAEPETIPSPVVESVEQPAALRDFLASNRLVTEFATCLWYLKTKYFKREWDDVETGDDDPRIRRALSRLSKSIDALKESGIEVHDPTNQHYPQGGEGMMRPIQFLPTAGVTLEMVSETVAPIIYRDDRLIQRGEVFVSIPMTEATETAASMTNSEPLGSETQTSQPSAELNSGTNDLGAANDEGCNGDGVSPEPLGTADEETPAENETAAFNSTGMTTVTAITDATPGPRPDVDGGERNFPQEPTGESN